MNSRRVFLLTVVLVLISMVGGFVTRTALGPNSIEQDGRFFVEPGQPVDSVVAQLDREGLDAVHPACHRNDVMTVLHCKHGQRAADS